MDQWDRFTRFVFFLFPNISIAYEVKRNMTNNKVFIRLKFLKLKQESELHA